MGIITLQLPPNLTPQDARRLEEGYLAGLPYFMPWLGSPIATDQQLILKYPLEESASLFVPWSIESMGRLMIGTPTLMDRDRPYRLTLEMARGKLHQVRGLAWEWNTAGVPLSGSLQAILAEANKSFRQGALTEDPRESEEAAQTSLQKSCDAAHELALQYVHRVFEVTHQRDGALDSQLSCRLGTSVPDEEQTKQILSAFTSVTLPISWHLVEAEETHYDWEAIDRLLDWAEAHHLDVTAGPLIDFSPVQRPGWWKTWGADPLSLATFMNRFVEAAVRRYRARITRWHVTASSNWARAFAIDEEVLLGTTQRLVETVRQLDSGLDIVVGLSQPWGEYLTKVARRNSPFDFADELTRCRVGMTALHLEIVMGIDGHGSFCRDLLETSKLLDLYAWLGIPLYLTLGYPSSCGIDNQADQGLVPARGTWRDGYTPESQADWASAFTALALCKPYVKEVAWSHFSDAEPHLFPNTGVLDASGEAKPMLDSLRRLREEHLPARS